MNITLISRFFDLRNEGIGRYSETLYKGLKNEIIKNKNNSIKPKNIKLKTISQDNSMFHNDNIISYLFFSLYEIKFKLPQSDVYHALSPIETFKINKKKTVVTIYDLMPIKIPELIYGSNNIKAKIVKHFMKKALENASKCEKIVAISEETANDLYKYYKVDPNRISIVRPAISSNLHPKNMKNDSFIVGTISNLNPRKRIDILIKSFLKADIPNSKLLIGGKGPQFEKLKKLTNNDNRIKFLGFIPDNELLNFYNSLDVFVFPSFMEGYGIPIIEAMACGKPVITLKDAHIPNDIKIKTHISSKSKLSTDLKNKNFKYDIKNNLKFAKKHSNENMAKQMLKIYKKIVI